MADQITVIRAGDHVTITDERVIVKVHSSTLPQTLKSIDSAAAADIAGALLGPLGVTVHDLPGDGQILKGAQAGRKMPEGIASVQIDTPLGFSGILSAQAHESAAPGSVSVGEVIGFVVELDYQAVAEAVAADERSTR